MNPALSVIFFTTLSGAGYGLLIIVGIEILFLSPTFPFADDPSLVRDAIFLMLAPLMGGIALTAIGLACSTFHLGKPQRAWRAFSQWQTSWLSREGIFAITAFAPAVLLLMMLASAAHGEVVVWPSGHALHWLGGVLAAASLITVGCTGMIYASLKPIPAWRHRLVVPIYLFFALLTGLLLFLAIFLTLGFFTVKDDLHLEMHVLAFVGLYGLVGALAAMKLKYWRDIDRIELPSRETATALEGFGTVTTFERPHTEANYLTREMGFVLARKHTRKLRAIAVLLFAGVPLLALTLAWLLPTVAGFALWVAALSALLGAFVERWLFFAEAKHMVTLYY